MTHIDEKIFKVSQTFLFGIILSLINIDTNNYGMDTNTKSTPVGKPLLNKYLSEKPRKEAWNYRTSVDVINYLQGNIRPYMYMTVHQTTHFCNNTMI